MRSVTRSMSALLVLLLAATALPVVASDFDHVLRLLAEYRVPGQLAVSREGTWLAYTSRSLDSSKVRLLLRQNQTGKTSILAETLMKSASKIAPCFSPDEHYLAYLGSDQGGVRLVIQELSSGKKQRIAEVRPLEGTALGSFAVWSADSSRVAFIGLQHSSVSAQALEREPMVRGSWSKMPEVKASFADDAKPTENESGLYPNRPGEVVQSLYVYDPIRRALSQLVLPLETAQFGFDLLGFSSHPDRLLIGLRNLAPVRHKIMQAYLDLYQIDLSSELIRRELVGNRAQGGDSLRAVRKTPVKLEFAAKAPLFLGAPRWSPDGLKIGYISAGAIAENDVTVYSLPDSRTMVLSGDLKPDSQMGAIPTLARNYAHQNKLLSFGTRGNGELQCRWMPDSSGIFFLRNGKELWLADANGNGNRLVWSAETGVTIRSILGDVYSSSAAVVDGGVLLETVGSAEAEWTELISVSLENGTRRTIYHGNSYFPSWYWAYSSIAHKAFFVTGSFERAGEYLGLAGGLVEINVKEGTNSWVLGDRDQPGVGISKVEQLHWKGQPGAPDEGGVLFIPAPTDRPPPCVIIVYPLSHKGVAYKTSLAPGGVAVALLASGYAVFQAQTEIVRNGKTREQIIQGTQRAVDALELTREVDPNRLAVLGHSFGGYAVNCILTGKSAFKAGVSISGISNMINLYYSQSGATGQAELNEPLYQHVEEYAANSPLLFADRVEVPLLLIHGARDESVPQLEANNMFMALRQLGKPAELAIYTKGEHDVISSEATRDDLVRRILTFFDYYVKQEPVKSRARLYGREHSRPETSIPTLSTAKMTGPEFMALAFCSVASGAPYSRQRQRR
jgi:dipeptidyl aminopeptidase/acylaminoacyl peptidase